MTLSKTQTTRSKIERESGRADTQTRDLVQKLTQRQESCEKADWRQQC